MSVNKRQKTVGQNDTPPNLIGVKDVSKTYLNYLLTEAGEMKSLVLKSGGDERLKHKILASIFYEVTALCHLLHPFAPSPFVVVSKTKLNMQFL